MILIFLSCARDSLYVRSARYSDGHVVDMRHDAYCRAHGPSTVESDLGLGFSWYPCICILFNGTLRHGTGHIMPDGSMSCYVRWILRAVPEVLSE